MVVKCEDKMGIVGCCASCSHYSGAYQAIRNYHLSTENSGFMKYEKNGETRGVQEIIKFPAWK